MFGQTSLETQWNSVVDSTSNIYKELKTVNQQLITITRLLNNSNNTEDCSNITKSIYVCSDYDKFIQYLNPLLNKQLGIAIQRIKDTNDQNSKDIYLEFIKTDNIDNDKIHSCSATTGSNKLSLLLKHPNKHCFKHIQMVVEYKLHEYALRVSIPPFCNSSFSKEVLYEILNKYYVVDFIELLALVE